MPKVDLKTYGAHLGNIWHEHLSEFLSYLQNMTSINQFCSKLNFQMEYILSENNTQQSLSLGKSN